MNRKDFIANLSKAIAIPLILPSIAFKIGNSSKVQHVVFCLIAGGMRNFESVLKKEGNLMPNLLNGNEAISSDIINGINFLPPIIKSPLENQGTFFKNFKYNSSETIHYSAHAAAITGNYHGNFEIMKPLTTPTVFEFFRKHNINNKSALNSWWVCDQAGPFPFLNFSSHKEYGSLFGANMIHPTSLFKINFDSFSFFSKETKEKIEQYKKLMLSFNLVKQDFPHKHGVINTEEDQEKIEVFLKNMSKNYFNKKPLEIWGLNNNLINEDIINVFTATEIIKTFKPELLVVNMQDSDIGHSNFTKMCNNINKADFALAKLWETIQSTPGMMDNTVLIAAPEFGRNLNNNTIVDQYGRYAVDHTGDENSKKIFCLILGPEKIIKRNNLIEHENAETIDILPTIAHLLGFYDKVPSQFINGKILKDAFV